MRVVKPTKLPVLHRVVEIRRRPYFHVAGILAFPLASPRALRGEMAFWQASASALGEGGVFDDGFAKAPRVRLFCGSAFAPPAKPAPMLRIGTTRDFCRFVSRATTLVDVSMALPPPAFAYAGGTPPSGTRQAIPTGMRALGAFKVP